MRILLLTTDGLDRNGLVHTLEAQGHEVIRASSGGEELLAAATHAGRVHAGLLSQVALGAGWPRFLRQLRRQVPSLPAVVLLGPESEQTWRLAILAGAFDALPESAPRESILRAVYKALSYTTGRPIGKPWLPDEPATRGAVYSTSSGQRQAWPAAHEYDSAA